MKQYTLQFETFDSLAQWLEGLDVKEVSATLVQIFRGELEAESLAVEIVKICKKFYQLKS